MRSLVVVTMLVLCGCDDGAEQTLPDAAEADFFGEACPASAAPAITVCRSDSDRLGWCVDAPSSGGSGICRPQCTQSDVRCDAGVVHYSSDGACYCAPS